MASSSFVHQMRGFFDSFSREARNEPTGALNPT